MLFFNILYFISLLPHTGRHSFQTANSLHICKIACCMLTEHFSTAFTGKHQSNCHLRLRPSLHFKNVPKSRPFPPKCSKGLSLCMFSALSLCCHSHCPHFSQLGGLCFALWENSVNPRTAFIEDTALDSRYTSVCARIMVKRPSFSDRLQCELTLVRYLTIAERLTTVYGWNCPKTL